MKSGIYVITNTTNGKVYVGSSKSLARRWEVHRRDLKANKHVNPHLLYAWQQCGAAAFHFAVLEYCEPSRLLERETWWMDLLQSRERQFGYNLWDPKRHDCSAETKAKLSASLMGNQRCVGRKPWNKGVPMPPETKAKVSDAKRGTKHTDDWKAAMSERVAGERHPMFGKTHTPEAREKIRARRLLQVSPMTGKTHSPEARRKMSDAAKGRIPWNKGTAKEPERRKDNGSIPG